MKKTKLLFITAIALLLSSCATMQAPVQFNYKEETAKLDQHRDSVRTARAELRTERKAEYEAAQRNGIESVQDTLLPATPIGGVSHPDLYLARSPILNHTSINYVTFNLDDPACQAPSWYHQYTGTHRVMTIRTCCINMGAEDLVIDTNLAEHFWVSPICVDGQYMEEYFDYDIDSCGAKVAGGYKELMWLVSDNGLYNVGHYDFWGDLIIQDQQELDSMLQYAPEPDWNIVFNPAGNGGTIFPPFYEEPYRMVIDRGAGDCYYNDIIIDDMADGIHNLVINPIRLPSAVHDAGVYPNGFETPFLLQGDNVTFYQTLPNCCLQTQSPAPVTGLDVSMNTHTLHWNASANAEGYNVYMALAYQDHGWHADSAMILLTPNPITATSYQYEHTGAFYYYFVEAVNCVGITERYMLNKKLK